LNRWRGSFGFRRFHTPAGHLDGDLEVVQRHFRVIGRPRFLRGEAQRCVTRESDRFGVGLKVGLDQPRDVRVLQRAIGEGPRGVV
jgi:hypothetical protein